MAFLFGCETVDLEFPTKTVLSHVSLGVDDGDRVGIVGTNGDGKSTLLKVLAGVIKPDDGRVLTRGSTTFSLLSQADDIPDDMSVSTAVVGDTPEYEWASSGEKRSVIDGLIGDLDWNGTVGSLSGGQRRRVDLARVLVSDADVLMLDEPTNHLDVTAIAWLAAYLKTRFSRGNGALMVVTHDRWFLDEVCERMWEVHDGSVDEFEGGYSAYILQRVQRAEAAMKAEQKRQNLLRRELAWLSRGARARATKPKFHVAIAQELIAGEPPVRNTIELKRAAMARLGKKVFDIADASFSYGGTPVIDDLTWMIGPGDRIGILGRNGAGKSTLLDLLRGVKHPQTGRVRIGKTVQIAYLSQQLHELDELGSDRVREVIARCKHGYVIDGKETSPSKLLERLGFTRPQLSMPVCDLSGGQKRRLQLMLILLENPNVLILDEPGNDLDTDMLTALEDLLDGWPGTLIMVTHDRYLMEHVTDDQYALVNGTIRHLPGGVDEYLKISSDFDRGERQGSNAFRTREEKQPADGAAEKPSGAEVHAARKRLASIERQMATMADKIDEAKSRQMQADPSDYVHLGEIQAEIADLQAKSDEFETEWLELCELIG